MLSRRLRYWLAAALLLGAAGCELNPQPGLPSREPSGPVAGGEGATNSGGTKPETPGAGGSLSLGGSAPTGTAGTGTDIGTGGEGAEPSDPGAAGAAAGGEGGASGEAGQSAGGAAP